ncbi:MAG: hypothetical protein IH577_04555 [Deltaproteobacteria bacterium]|nr:hypothetical protein [Deltaproteobacteria bacterium]
MKLYRVDVEWNHKGTHYLKKHHAPPVRASSTPSACRVALADAKKTHPRSIREVVGARFYFTVTVIEQVKQVEAA